MPVTLPCDRNSLSPLTGNKEGYPNKICIKANILSTPVESTPLLPKPNVRWPLIQAYETFYPLLFVCLKSLFCIVASVSWALANDVILPIRCYILLLRIFLSH